MSYDPTRAFYDAYNEWFSAQWRARTGEALTVEVSHGGSGKQARGVVEGLQADVVTLALAPDIDLLHTHGGLVRADWADAFANHSSPYTSTVVFVVRQGNPRNIRDWDDLVREGVGIVHPNPKTSGGARWGVIAAWGYALRRSGGDEAAARTYLRQFLAGVRVMDTGARGSTTTFARNGIGDVLVSWENEAHLLLKEMPQEGFEIVVPSLSILALPPVAVVDRVVDARGTRDVATAYLEGLYQPEAQRLAGQHGYRPSDSAILAEFSASFPAVERFTIEDVAGSWPEAQARFFGEGGIFDQLYGQR